MKKLFSILLALVLVIGLMTGVVASDPAIAGNTVEPRPNGPDSRVDFYIVDRNNGFIKESIMTGFSVYVGRLSRFRFMVYKEVGSSWEIVYTGDEILPTELGVYTHELSSPELIPAGSYVGLYYPENGAIEYTMFGTNVYNNLNDGPVCFSNAHSTIFANSSDRVYSISAFGYEKQPIAEWLPPISLENFELNERATLPIKFRLDGVYADVKLMVGDGIDDEEIDIKYQSDEENGDFYLGLFRPSEGGTFTARVLVNGVEIKVREFNVFEIAPNGKGKGPK